MRNAKTQCLNIDSEAPAHFTGALTTMAQYHTINNFQHSTGIFAAKERLPYTFHKISDHHNQDQLPQVFYGLQQDN